MGWAAQPGRRFGTEPRRKTTLMLGYDIPLDLDAEIALPSGAKVIDVGKHLRKLSPLYEMVQDGIDLTKIQWAAH